MSISLKRGGCEEEEARLLPWYVAGRVNASDSERVTRHLEHCAICRDDLRHERALRSLIKSETSLDYAPQPGLARTLARIDDLAYDAPTAVPIGKTTIRAPSPRFGLVHWLAAAAVVQAVGLGVMSTLLVHRSLEADREPRFATLSSAPVPVAPGAHIRVVFSPSMTMSAVKSLLGQHALTIIRGPSDAGAYTLAFTDPSSATTQRLAPAMAALRSDVRVVFVEPAVNDESGRW
jgi:hypothetical protein